MSGCTIDTDEENLPLRGGASQEKVNTEKVRRFQTNGPPPTTFRSCRFCTHLSLSIIIIQICSLYYLWSKENAWTFWYESLRGGQRWDGRTSLLVDSAIRALPKLLQEQHDSSLPSNRSSLCISIVADARPYSLVTIASVLANIRDLPQKRNVSLVILDHGVLPNTLIEQYLRTFITNSERSNIPKESGLWQLSLKRTMKEAFAACRKRAPRASHIMWLEGDALVADHGLTDVFNDVLDHWEPKKWACVKLYHRVMRQIRWSDVWLNFGVAVLIALLIFFCWWLVGLKPFNRLFFLFLPLPLLAMFCLVLALSGYRNFSEAIYEPQRLVPGFAVYATGLIMSSEDATNFGNFITKPGFSIDNDNAIKKLC